MNDAVKCFRLGYEILFNYGDLACLLFESNIFISCPESCGTGCSKVRSQSNYYCSKLWI